MSVKRVILLLCVLLAGPTVANADAFNLELSNASARFIYATEMYGSQYGPMDMEFGAYFDENKDKMLTVGLLVRNDTLDSPLVISIGTRFYYASAGNAPGETQHNVAALTIGGELLYFPKNLKGIGFGAFAFAAPSVVAFLDADGFREYGARVEYEITKQASIYGGYAEAKADIKDGTTATIKQGLFVGLGMRF